MPRPCRCRSRIMTMSPSRTTGCPPPEREASAIKRRLPDLAAYAVRQTGEFSIGTFGEFSLGSYTLYPMQRFAQRQTLGDTTRFTGVPVPHKVEAVAADIIQASEGGVEF